MKIVAILLAAILLMSSCQKISSKEAVSTTHFNEKSNLKEYGLKISSIREVNFYNFTFPWTKKFGYGEKTFILKNGISDLSDNKKSDTRKLSLESLSYTANDDRVLIVIRIDDGNATYQMLYVYEVENNAPKLLESFEFGENGVLFGSAYEAHGELVIGTYNYNGGEAECCPSIIEISYYRWEKDKFVKQGESQKLPNGYVERTKKKVEKN